MRIEAYLYVRFERPPVEQVDRAWQILAGIPAERLWLDVEDATSLAPAKVIEYIEQCVAASQEHGATGLYTGGWWWVPKTGNTDRFKDVPLWYSRYDGVPSLDTWPSQAFGGWEQPEMKQYRGTTQVCGIGVDLNVRRR